MTQAGSALATVSRDEAKRFLVGLANLRDDQGGFAWFKKNYPYVLDTVDPAQLRTQAMYSEGEAYEFELPDTELIQRYWLLPLRDSVRAIWRAPDARTKQWGVFRILQDFFLQADPDRIRSRFASSSDFFFSGLKPPVRTERLLLQFMNVAEFTRFCAGPECLTPYFFAGRRSQKYCAPECSTPAQREFKRDWWNRKGRQWRAAQAKKK